MILAKRRTCDQMHILYVDDQQYLIYTAICAQEWREMSRFVRQACWHDPVPAGEIEFEGVTCFIDRLGLVCGMKWVYKQYISSFMLICDVITLR